MLSPCELCSVRQFHFAPGSGRISVIPARFHQLDQSFLNPPLEIEGGISLSVIGESPGKAAYALKYGQANIVIPAGVDYAVIMEAHPGLLENTDLLILSPSDTSYIPPRL